MSPSLQILEQSHTSPRGDPTEPTIDDYSQWRGGIIATSVGKNLLSTLIVPKQIAVPIVSLLKINNDVAPHSWRYGFLAFEDDNDVALRYQQYRASALWAGLGLANRLS